MADGIDEVGAVQRVEVKLGNTLIDQPEHLLGGNGGSDQMARLLVVVQAFEAVAKPVGYACAGFGGEAGALLEIVDGNDAGHDGNGDAGRADAIEIAEEYLIV